MDKVGKNTGQGLIEELPMTDGQGAVCLVDLYNYNIDGNMLKPAHQDYLRRKIIPFLLRSEHHVKLRGHASQSGDFEYNKNLSIERVLRVKKFLRDHGVPESKVPGGNSDNMFAYGETRSIGAIVGNPEHERDRRVRLIVYQGIKALPSWEMILGPIGYSEIPPPSPEPQPVPTAPPSTKHPWAIRQIMGASVEVGAFSLKKFGVGGGSAQFSFLLFDRRNNTMSQCTFAGIGPSAGVDGTPITFSMTEGSRTWNRFETDEGVSHKDMEGDAIWLEPPTGTGSAQLQLRNIGKTINVETGTTWGLPGAKAIGGYFVCREPIKQRAP